MKLEVARFLAALLLATGALAQDSQALGERSLGADFAQAPLAERRARVARVRAQELQPSLEELELALQDSDEQVRVELAHLHGALKLQGDQNERRVARLEVLAGRDAALPVRRAALDGLAAVRGEAAARALLRLSLELAPEEAPSAALQLVSFSTGRELAFEAVRDAFRAGLNRAERPVPVEVLAAWFSTYGRTLAEHEGGGDEALDRAPLVLGDSHPYPLLRGAAQNALNQCLLRLRELERHERADRLLARLAGDGLAARETMFLRVRAALAEGGVDPQVALSGARELGRLRGDSDPWSDQRWRFRAVYLEGIALLALDRPKEANTALVRAGDLLDGLLEQRVDESGKQGAVEQRDLLHERSLVEFARAFGWLAAGRQANDLAVLEALRRAHQVQLEAQLVATEGDVGGPRGLDWLLDAVLSPYELIFAARPHAAWQPERCLELQLGLGRGLASVSAREMPGFEPFADLPSVLADPLQDPRRAGLLGEIAAAEIQALQQAIEKLRVRLAESTRDEAELEQVRTYLLMALRRAKLDVRDKSLEQRFYDLRLPGAAALRLAEAMRREGQNAGSRRLAEGLAVAMEESDLAARYPWAVRLAAQAHMVIGGGWTDDDEPQAAEAEMLKGLALFEGLEQHHLDRGAPGMAEVVQGNIASALVALAVNANVKSGDAERALEFFERAYELEQDDFMSIMLACYRARSGRAEEARELLADIPESPRGYYNLACTYALLGEKERALDLLELDLKENRRSEAALEKQKAWAREDPDLEALRGDPRFEFLTEG